MSLKNVGWIAPLSITKQVGSSALIFLSLVACAEGNFPGEIVVFGDTGYGYDYAPWWYREGVFDSAEDFEAGFQAYWEGVKGTGFDEFEVPYTEYVKSLGGYVFASGLHHVAEQMKAHCLESDCAFSLMVGDGIYPSGATGGSDGIDDDARLRDLLSVPFGELGQGDPDFRIYSVLGNHDWETSRAGAEVQLEYLESTSPFYMDGYFYSVKPPVFNGRLEVFAIDTNLLLATQDIPVTRLGENGRPLQPLENAPFPSWVNPNEEAERSQLQWLKSALEQSEAEWKIVVGHHPLWSAGGSKYEESRVLRRLILEPLCRYADFYVAGHEHTLEMYSDSCESVLGAPRETPLVSIVSGAGAVMSPRSPDFVRYQETSHIGLTNMYSAGMLWGYAVVDFANDSPNVRLYEVQLESDVTSRRVLFEYGF